MCMVIDPKLVYEAKILALAVNARPLRDVFVLKLDCILTDDLQAALGRLTRRGWVRLIDIVQVNGVVYRYFHVTEAATSWYHHAWAGRDHDGTT